MKLAYRDVPLDDFVDAFEAARSQGHPGHRPAGRHLMCGKSMGLGPVDGFTLRLHHLSQGATLLSAEGPLSAAVEGAAGLTSPDRIDDAARHVKHLCRSLRLPLNPWKRATLARIDLATDVRFTDSDRAQAFLRAVGSLRPPGLVRTAYSGHDCAPIRGFTFDRETKRGLRTQFRVYDCDVRHDGARVGRTVRLERQIVRRRRDQTTLTAWRTADCGRLLLPAPLSLAGVVVRNPSDLAEAICNLVGHPWPNGCGHDGQVISETVAHRLIGAAIRYRDVGDAAWSTKRGATRGRRELRALRLIPSERNEPPYDLGAVFRSVSDAWTCNQGERSHG